MTRTRIRIIRTPRPQPRPSLSPGDPNGQGVLGVNTSVTMVVKKSVKMERHVNGRMAGWSVKLIVSAGDVYAFRRARESGLRFRLLLIL